jgi:putative heme-binding domain-containing protein
MLQKYSSVNEGNHERRVRDVLQSVADAFTFEGLKPPQAAGYFDDALRRQVDEIAASHGAGRIPATIIGLWWNDPAAVKTARQIIADPGADITLRGRFLRALGDLKDAGNADVFAALLYDNGAPILIRQNAATALGAMDDARAAGLLVSRFDQLPTDLRPMVINATVLSKVAAKVLLDSIKAGNTPLSFMNENHARAIANLNDAALARELADVWGTIRTERDPQRVKVAAEYKRLFLSRGGDPARGWKVFDAKCAQCHAIYGRGGTIGPDLTGVGRDNLDLLLSNVLDPSLVIGKPYYVYVAKKKDGSSVSGLLVEDSDKQVVLKDPTGQFVVPRSDLARLVQQNS